MTFTQEIEEVGKRALEYIKEQLDKHTEFELEQNGNLHRLVKETEGYILHIILTSWDGSDNEFNLDKVGPVMLAKYADNIAKQYEEEERSLKNER